MTGNALHESIDWISFTVPTGSKKVWPEALESSFQEGRPLNGYSDCKEYDDGRLELENKERPDMGIHCILSGSTCSNLRNSLLDVMENVWAQKGKITRVDFALDDYLGRINPQKANEYLKKGKVICRAKQTPYYDDPRQPGNTQYFGRLASEVMLRIYDKDCEQGIYGFRTRIEIKFSGRKANIASKAYIQHGDSRGLVSSYIRFPEWRDWNELFSMPPIPVPAEKKDKKVVIWLLTTCARSMAKEILNRGGDLELMDEFYKSVLDNMSSMRHSDADVDNSNHLVA